MKWIKNYDKHTADRRINEEFIGKLFGKLKDKLSLGFSKMFGTAKEVEEMFKKYESEILKRQEVQNKTLSDYAEYIAQVKMSGEKDENKIKELTTKIETARGKFQEEVKLLKQKFDIEFKNITDKEENPKIKNYINLKKIELQLSLLNKETESLLGEGKLTEEDIDNDPILKSIKEKSEKLSKDAEETKKFLESEEKQTGFNLDRAKELTDQNQTYVWEESPYTKDTYKFEKDDEILYFSVSNYKDSQDKKAYTGTKATVLEEVEGDSLKVDTETSKDIQIKKTAVIKAPNKEKEEETTDKQSDEESV
jgi:DNA-binding helix-hairpin-helix protein with protein kinase domain